MRTVSHKTLDYQLLGRAKTPIFSAIIFLAVIFILYAESSISDVPLQPASPIDAKEETHQVLLRIHATERRIKTAIPDVSLRSVHEEEKTTELLVDAQSHENSLFIPPFNASEEERIEWFRRKLPELEFFESNDLTHQFHRRVLEFFNKDCEVQVFMTWISPAEAFGRREFLALDSLSKVHPGGCLMILSRSLDSPHGYRILKPLLDRGFRVLAASPDLPFLFKKTPAEVWFEEIKSGNKDPGEIPLAQNLSNLIRLAVLYKYGGVYMDTDFIVLKSFTSLRNSIGAQSIDAVSKHWTRLNNAVLVFDRKHPLLHKFLQEFASTFDGNRWGHNGPYLVSRVVQKVAGRPRYNFTILPPMAFYPVDWTKIEGWFKKPENQAGSRWVKAKLIQLSGETYGVHLWNKQSSRFVIEEGSVMDRLISEHCIICEYKYSS